MEQECHLLECLGHCQHLFLGPRWVGRDGEGGELSSEARSALVRTSWTVPGQLQGISPQCSANHLTETQSLAQIQAWDFEGVHFLAPKLRAGIKVQRVRQGHASIGLRVSLWKIAKFYSLWMVVFILTF